MSTLAGRLARRDFLLSAAAAAWLAPAMAVRGAPRDDNAFAFFVLGDWGVRGERAQRQVAGVMARVAEEANARLVLTAGDNFYPAGVRSADDSHWRTSFEAVYDAPALQVPWCAALGNHDYRGEPAAQVAYGRLGGRWRMPARYYAMQDRSLLPADLDVFVLDTTPMCVDADETLARLVHGRVSVPRVHPQLAWLEAQLSCSSAAWKVVVGHHPIHSGGRHGGSAHLEAHLEPLLERYGVQAYLCGHDHVLQHIRVGRTDHICSGAGSSAGQVTAVDGTLFAAGVPGFALLTLSPAADALHLTFKGADGATLYAADIPRGV